ncbi:hypothetical protein [Brucella pituitosa]|uniref:hypothetical protein n=1 Tax=Brucella pituitosa TaxID=571256 RepID=UPI0009A1E718|nr:hypothetical protein [Brucella pituitosa]
MTTPFEGLREELLIAGIKSGYVKRYLYELTQHFLDLRDHLELQGNSRMVAEKMALQRMGETRHLAQAMAAQPKLRSLVATYPKTALVLAPLALLHIAILVLCIAAVILGRIAEPTAAPQIGRLVTFLCNIGMPMLFGWIAVFLSLKQRLQAFWTILGLTCLAFLSSAIDFRTMLPHVDTAGEIAVRIGDMPMVTCSFLALLLSSLVPYCSLRGWLHRDAIDHSVDTAP